MRVECLVSLTFVQQGGRNMLKMHGADLTCSSARRIGVTPTSGAHSPPEVWGGDNLTAFPHEMNPQLHAATGDERRTRFFLYMVA